MTGSVETFSSLRHRNYLRWFLGQTVSMLGYFVQNVALAVLVLDLSDNGAVLGAVTALNFLPIVILGPWAGVVSDRVDKREFLLITQAVMMVCALLLGVVVLAGVASIWLVSVIALASGCVFAMDQPARRTVVVELVPERDAANAVSLNGALGQMAKVAGPVVAGLLIATVGIGWCFIVNGLTSIAVLIALVRMDTTEMYRSAPLERRAGQISEGVRYIVDDVQTRRTLTVLGVLGLAAMSWNVLVPLLVMQDFDGSPTRFAIVMGWMSIGSVVGLLWLARRPQPGSSVLTWSTLVMGAGLVGLTFAPSIAASLPFVFVVGAAGMVIVNGTAVTLQLAASPEMRGRVMAAFSIVLLGSYAIGSAIAGAIAEEFGTQSAFALGAAVSLITAVWLLLLERADRLSPASAD